MKKFLSTTYGVCVAMIAKSGSTAIAEALLAQQFPELKPVAIGPGATRAGWQRFAPKVDQPDVPVLVPVREPVSRFLSACVQTKVASVDAALDELEAGGALAQNVHFTPSSDYLKDHGQECRLFRFPEHLPELMAACGLEGDLSVFNEALREKFTLTEVQLDRVLNYYAEDAALFAGITVPG